MSIQIDEKMLEKLPLASTKKRKLVLEKTHYCCAYCGVDIVNNYRQIIIVDSNNQERYALCSFWHVDHIVPRSKGGSNKIENLFASCDKCNMRKYTKSLEEFRKVSPFKTNGFYFEKLNIKV